MAAPQESFRLKTLIEEIVGNLQDEYDEEEAEIERRDETTFVVDGQTALDDVAAAVGVNMPEDDYDTLAGTVSGFVDRTPTRASSRKSHTAT